MKKSILIVFFFLFYGSLVLAQPPCTSNPVANDFCQSATPICNLNGYCGNTSSTYTYWVSPTNHANETNTPLGTVFCATIQNNSWLKFIADSSVAVFDVWVSNCAHNHGIQMQIYTTTNCYNYTPVSNCWNPGSPTNGQITAVGLIPGNVYFFMIDGTNGDVCDYVIAANVGVGSTFTITPDQSVCKGDSAVITASGGATYSWTSSPYDPSLTTQSSFSTVKVKPTTTTFYSVIVTKSGSNAFCPNNIDTLYSLVTVKPLPIINMSSSKDHCGVGDGSATATVSGGSGVFLYSWNTSPTQTTSIATNLFQGNYKVTVTDTNGCKVKDSVMVLMDTLLAPQITGQPFLCHATTAVLNAGSNYSSYLWSTGATTQTITISNAATYIVKVTKNNCSGSDTLAVVDITVPPPQISGPNYICAGDTVQLNAGSGYFSYQWSNNASTRLVSITAGGTYSVIVSDTNGCKANSSFIVLQKSGPSLITSSVNEICDRMNGSATVIASGGQGNYIYLWSNGGDFPSISGLHQGIYNIAVSDSFCTSKTTVKVKETPGPSANFSVDPEFQIYIGEALHFNFQDLSQGSIINWLWNFDDASAFGTTQNISHDYNAVKNYNVTLIVMDTNACIDSFSKVIIVRDIFTFYIPNSFTPNGDGVNDVFTPKGYNVDAGKFEMYIYNRWGNLVYSTKNWNGESSDPWNGTYNNSGKLNDVLDGVYVYKIIVKESNGPEHLYSGKIVVIH
ncbi:MAG: gliding motility-associated C-terminal domain-containing protein [Bacteroidales bacterium]